MYKPLITKIFVENKLIAGKTRQTLYKIQNPLKMIHLFNTLIIESKESSLTELCHLLKTQSLSLNPFIKNTPNVEELADADIALVEIKEECDLKKMEQLNEFQVKVIVLLNNEKLLREVIELEASSILLPPPDTKQVIKAIEKVKAMCSTEKMTRHMDSVIHLQNAKKSNNIIIPTTDGFEVLRINEIIRIEAERAYCTVFLLNGRKVTVSKPLKEVEVLLPPDLFYRSHVSHLININSILGFRKDDGGSIVLTDGSKVPVAKSRKDDLVDMLVG